MATSADALVTKAQATASALLEGEDSSITWFCPLPRSPNPWLQAIGPSWMPPSRLPQTWRRAVAAAVAAAVAPQ